MTLKKRRCGWEQSLPDHLRVDNPVGIKRSEIKTDLRVILLWHGY